VAPKFASVPLRVQQANFGAKNRTRIKGWRCPLASEIRIKDVLKIQANFGCRAPGIG